MGWLVAKGADGCGCTAHITYNLLKCRFFSICFLQSVYIFLLYNKVICIRLVLGVCMCECVFGLYVESKYKLLTWRYVKGTNLLLFKNILKYSPKTILYRLAFKDIGLLVCVYEYGLHSLNHVALTFQQILNERWIYFVLFWKYNTEREMYRQEDGRSEKCSV